jgi:hypothetical protein
MRRFTNERRKWDIVESKSFVEKHYANYHKDMCLITKNKAIVECHIWRIKVLTYREQVMT